MPRVKEVEEQHWGVREAEDVGGMEVEELQELVASRWPRSSRRLPDMEEMGAVREFLFVGAKKSMGTAIWHRETCNARKNPARRVCLADLQEDGRDNGKKEINTSPGWGQGHGGTEEEQPRKFLMKDWKGTGADVAMLDQDYL